MIIILAWTLSATNCTLDSTAKLGHHLFLFLFSSFGEYLLLFESFEFFLLDNIVVQILYVFVQVGLLTNNGRVPNRTAQIILLAIRLTCHWILISLRFRYIVIALSGT